MIVWQVEVDRLPSLQPVRPSVCVFASLHKCTKLIFIHDDDDDDDKVGDDDDERVSRLRLFAAIA